MKNATLMSLVLLATMVVPTFGQSKSIDKKPRASLFPPSENSFYLSLGVNEKTSSVADLLASLKKRLTSEMKFPDSDAPICLSMQLIVQGNDFSYNDHSIGYEADTEIKNELGDDFLGFGENKEAGNVKSSFEVIRLVTKSKDPVIILSGVFVTLNDDGTVKTLQVPSQRYVLIDGKWQINDGLPK